MIRTYITNIYFEYKEHEFTHYGNDQYVVGLNPSKSSNIYGISLNESNKLESPYQQNIYGLSLTYGRFDSPNKYVSDETGKNIYGITLGLFENGIDSVTALSINLSQRTSIHNLINVSLLYSKSELRFLFLLQSKQDFFHIILLRHQERNYYVHIQFFRFHQPKKCKEHYLHSLLF